MAFVEVEIKAAAIVDSCRQEASTHEEQTAPHRCITLVALTVLIGLTLLAQQDRYTLKVPDGLAFSEFKGYDTWQDVAVSETEGSVKAILGNLSLPLSGMPSL